VRIVLVIASIAALAAGVWLAAKGHGTAWWAFALAALFVFVAYIDSIQEVTIGTEGLKAVSKDVREIQVGLKDLQQVMIAMARSIVTVAECSGRMGGMPDEVSKAMTERLREALELIQIRDPGINTDFLAEVHLFVEFDYVLHILGGATIPDRDQAVVTEWRTLRHFGSRPTPEELEAFFATHGFDTEERLERVEDYRFYRRNRMHRRPTEWDRRTEWGRLT